MEKKHEHYDVIIIGGGPAGLTAALYAGRAQLNTLLIEKSLLGGLATYTSDIWNYPGFPDGVSGLDLMKLFEKQAKAHGAKVKLTPVKAVDLAGEDKTVETFRNVFHAPAVIVATGGKPRLLNVPNEERFLYDKGISFCATCDAASCTDKTVMVIGSGDAAIEEAIFLTKFAREVIISVIHEEGHMDAHKVAQDEALHNEKISFLWSTEVDHFEGEDRLETVVLKNNRSGDLKAVPVDRCFYFIGYIPATDIFKAQVEMTERGYIPTNERMQTNVEGVFAAGDCRQTCLRQVATAVGDGAVAGFEAERYIAEQKVFKEELMQKEKVGLIFVYSAIDAPSRALLPEMEKIDAAFHGDIKLSVVDAYKGECLAAMLGKVAMPSVVYTKDGEIVDKSADLDPTAITRRLTELTASA